jgi:DNA-binding GntR family transcriptional regulator
MVTKNKNIEPVQVNTLRDHALEQLKSMIMKGELEAGSKLTETFLSKSLGISRAPLREAIRELIDMRLLVSQPYKGLFVRTASPEDLEEIYSLRTLLEKLAFERCWHKRTPEQLDKLKQLNAALIETIDQGNDADESISRELNLHSWCYTLSEHSLLIDSWERLKPSLHFYFTYHQRAHKRKGPFREAHEEYVALASGDDLPAMLDYLEKHMRQGLDTTIKHLESTKSNHI